MLPELAGVASILCRLLQVKPVDRETLRYHETGRYASPSGVETRVSKTVCLPRHTVVSLDLAVGEPVTYVQAPKAKGHVEPCTHRFSNSPTRGLRAVCGGAPQTRTLGKCRAAGLSDAPRSRAGRQQRMDHNRSHRSCRAFVSECRRRRLD